MREILHNMFRRKTRTILTIFGITIGIFAFTVMGSMAEKISLLVNGGTKYYSDKVIVSDASANLNSLPVPMNVHKAQEIEKVDGVAAVASTIFVTLPDSSSGVSLGIPPGVSGSDLKGHDQESFKIYYKSGRELTENDRGKAVVGTDLVKKLNAKVGENIRVFDADFEVVGIMEKTLTAPDNEVFVSLEDAQKILYKSLPDIIKGQTKPEELANSFTVYIKKDVDPNKLAEKINKEISGVSATGPNAFEDQIASATGVFNSILIGIALISLFVGGLSIINTMTMAISERTREIGIKKAVGAPTRSIMLEFLTEAGMIGLFGGLLGWGLGAIMVISLNKIMEASTTIFLLTSRISFAAVIFAVVVGVLAGIYPAYYAVKINIVKALREA